MRVEVTGDRLDQHAYADVRARQGALPSGKGAVERDQQARNQRTAEHVPSELFAACGVEQVEKLPCNRLVLLGGEAVCAEALRGKAGGEVRFRRGEPFDERAGKPEHEPLVGFVRLRKERAVQLVRAYEQQISRLNGERRALDLVAKRAGEQQVTLVKVVKMQRNVQFPAVFVMVDFVVFQKHVLALLKDMLNGFHSRSPYTASIEQYSQCFKQDKDRTCRILLI
ncbi:hypothetical protein SDC9_144562 [bioreactor metagenome]|uniref:Uncharacterized protein n=1 Tax=bioreactor metagenome TaxID=1076179 RepID=A0A645E787_9ZZZZ